MNLSEDILNRLKTLFDEPVSLSEPFFDSADRSAVSDCVASGWVSSVGQYVDQFEKQLAELHQVRHAIACVNGTAALQVALKIVGVREGDEVLMPSFSFVATANAASFLGAIPHFVDVDPATLGLHPTELRDYLRTYAEMSNGLCRNKKTGRPIRALVPMHTFGNPVDMIPLMEVAAEFGLTLVEDAAESIGTLYRGRRTGSFGKVAALSFNGNKIITTGGGGAILTSDSELAQRAKHLTTTAKLAHAWAFEHDEIGYNYRLPNLNAALGVSQLQKLDRLLAGRKNLFRRYQKEFQDLAGARLFSCPSFGTPNHWMIALVLDKADLRQRDEILNLTNRHKIQTRPAWNLLHTLPMYKSNPRGPLRYSEDLYRRIINLPSSSHLGFESE